MIRLMAIVFIAAIGLASPISSPPLQNLTQTTPIQQSIGVFLTMIPKKVWIYYLVSFILLSSCTCQCKS
jgi:hypothetical protein